MDLIIEEKCFEAFCSMDKEDVGEIVQAMVKYIHCGKNPYKDRSGRLAVNLLLPIVMYDVYLRAEEE